MTDVVTISENGTRFHVEHDSVDVTSCHRPDTAWSVVDAAGHRHAWHVSSADGSLVQATGYSPQQRYELPTLEHIEDVPATDEYPAVSHYECRECREHIRPGYRADDTRQMVPGLRRHYVNDEPVSREEFERLVREAFPGRF